MTDVPVGGASFFDAALSSALLLLLLLLSFHPPFDILLLIRPCISPVYLVSHQHTFYLRLLYLCVCFFYFRRPWRGVADHRVHTTHDLSVLDGHDDAHSTILTRRSTGVDSN